MSIYIEKRNGRPTGFWKVEVTIHGQRHLARTNSYEDALRIEHELKVTGSKLESSCVQKYTLGQLHDDIIDRLWAGQKDEDYARKRWRRCLTILGPDTPVTEVRFARMERVADRLRADGLNPKTINRHLATVSKALRWAYKRELIPSMPPIPRLPEADGRIAFLRQPEVPRFLKYLYDHERPSTALCLEVLLVTGMRAGELMGLKSHNIELDGDECSVVLEDTKTGDGRTIPLARPLGEQLLAIVRDKLPDYDLLLRACHRASQALDTRDTITPHVLRHTTATLLSAKGTPSLVVADLLGHKNLATTRKYAHPTREALKDATAAMAALGGEVIARGKLVVAGGETRVKTVATSGSPLLQSAPFAARDIPPITGEDLEKPKASVKRPKANKKRTKRD